MGAKKEKCWKIVANSWTCQRGWPGVKAALTPHEGLFCGCHGSDRGLGVFLMGCEVLRGEWWELKVHKNWFYNIYQYCRSIFLWAHRKNKNSWPPQKIGRRCLGIPAWLEVFMAFGRTSFLHWNNTRRSGSKYQDCAADRFSNQPWGLLINDPNQQFRGCKDEKQSELIRKYVIVSPMERGGVMPRWHLLVKP